MSGQNMCCPEMLSGHIFKVNLSTGGVGCGGGGGGGGYMFKRRGGIYWRVNCEGVMREGEKM